MLVEQVDHPVLWKQSMTSLFESGHSAAVEFGPGKVLSGLNKRIASAIGKTIASYHISDTATLQAFSAIKKGSANA